MLQPKVADSALLSQRPWLICQLQSILYPAQQSWVYEVANVGSLSAFPWTKFMTALLLCFSRTDRAATWDSGACMSARPVLLSFICCQWVWLGIRRCLCCTLKFLSNSADYRGAKGEPRASNQVSISAASGLPESLADISACKLASLWPFTILKTLYLYPILSFLLTPPFLRLCFACPRELSLGVSKGEDKRGIWKWCSGVLFWLYEYFSSTLKLCDANNRASIL